MTNGSTLQFRIAAPDDAVQLQQLIESAFRAEDSRAGWTADMELGRQFRYKVEEVLTTINRPDARVLMAFDSTGALVGSVDVVKRTPDLARVAMLSVDPNQQRGGIGRQLIAYAEDYCRREWGVGKFGLNALSTRDKLLAWYERCGYQRTGETTPFPVERFPDLDLPRDLHFVELEKNAASETI